MQSFQVYWCLDRKQFHAGMSGGIFGFFGYLIATACFGKSISSFVPASIALGYLGAIFAGLRPKKGVSFEAHAFGLMAGVVKAWMDAG